MATHRQVRSGDVGWQRLYEMWVAERRPGNLVDSQDNYVVMTPNGENDPIFVDQGTGEDLYKTTSGPFGPPSR